ncbi:MAG: zinc ribbon domain-containing protein [Pseudomonadales bacterium]|nr:zinc ribbon domain-containing protein [Pseudomonadales bacterium]
MPIYEYVCDQCGHQLEAFQTLSEGLLTVCPECSEESLRKKISAAGFRLKGGGWYETDFKSGNKKNVAGSETSSSSDSSSGGSSSSGSSSSGSSSSGSSSSDSSSGSSSSSGSTSSSSKSD